MALAAVGCTNLIQAAAIPVCFKWSTALASAASPPWTGARTTAHLRAVFEPSASMSCQSGSQAHTGWAQRWAPANGICLLLLNLTYLILINWFPVPGAQEEAARQGEEPAPSGVYHNQCVPDVSSRWISEGPLFLAARKPYVELVPHHSLGWMNIECPSCNALHWMAEKRSSSSKYSPQFNICYSDGRVSLPLLQPPPEPLQSLLTSINCPALKFQEDIWRYNCACVLSFMLLGIHKDRSTKAMDHQSFGYLASSIIYYVPLRTLPLPASSSTRIGDRQSGRSPPPTTTALSLCMATSQMSCSRRDQKWLKGSRSWLTTSSSWVQSHALRQWLPTSLTLSLQPTLCSHFSHVCSQIPHSAAPHAGRDLQHLENGSPC